MQLSKTKLRELSFLILLLLFIHPNICSQSVSIQASVGIIDLPLRDWSNFIGSVQNSFYTKNNPNLYYGVCVFYDFNFNHSVFIGTELIRTNASESSQLTGITPNSQTYVLGSSTVDWKFQGIPVVFGYEYHLMIPIEYLTPFFGIGISYFFSEVKAHESYFNQTEKRTGQGYGVDASIGLKTKLVESLFMVSQFRYRYSNGMAFTDNSGDIKVEFSGFSFSTGIRLTFL